VAHAMRGHIAARDQPLQPILRPPAPSFESLAQRSSMSGDFVQSFLAGIPAICPSTGSRHVEPAWARQAEERMAADRVARGRGQADQVLALDLAATLGLVEVVPTNAGRSSDNPAVLGRLRESGNIAFLPMPQREIKNKYFVLCCGSTGVAEVPRTRHTDHHQRAAVLSAVEMMMSDNHTAFCNVA
jgi:hypothetical protein